MNGDALQQVSNATAAWVEAWLHGNAQPRVISAPLERLAARSVADPLAHDLVLRGQRVVASHPFGSVPEAFSTD